MAVAAEFALRRSQQARNLGGMGDVAGFTFSGLERRMLSQGRRCGQGSLMTAGTELLAFSHEQVGTAIVGCVAGGAFPGRHRRMQYRQARLGTDAGMTAGTEVPLHVNQKRLTSRSVGIVAEGAFIRSRGVNHGCAGLGRIIMAGDTHGQILT